MSRSIRILCRIDWADEDETVSRLWDGSGPYQDDNGDRWIGCGALSGLDALEQAINGEASTLTFSLTGVAPQHAAIAWLSFTNDEIKGSAVTILIQNCDPVTDQPLGEPEVWFTGEIDNPVFADKATADGVQSTITIEVTDRFALRRLTGGAVLSDTDQRARSAVLNPSAPPDRFCEGVHLLQDVTIVWPRWTA